MRFRATIQNIHTFTKFTASLAPLGHIAWVRLDDKDVRFTVIPDQGTQVWSVLSIDTIFETYNIESATANNTINLEVPLAPLLRALKSAQNAIAANIRLTKKAGVPLLSLTITTTTIAGNASSTLHQDGEIGGEEGVDSSELFGDVSTELGSVRDGGGGGAGQQDRETTITQDIPVRVLAPASVEGLHEPRCREPDVHITLPNLQQLKSISDRFTRLALSSSSTSGSGSSNKFNKSSQGGAFNSSQSSYSGGPKLELSGNMHGCLRLSLKADSHRISSLWTGLENPELDPDQVADGAAGLENHPSTRMKALGDATGRSEEGWATVRIEGRDWGRVLGVGRLGGRVIACFCHEHALILYVFIGGGDSGVGESVLTYYISSYSA